MAVELGPEIRVGVLQNEEALTFELRGSYIHPESKEKYSRGQWRAEVNSSTPARMKYTLIHKKCFSTEDARAFIDRNPQLADRWITVGENITHHNRTLQGCEFWVAGKSFPTLRKAEEHKLSFENAEYIDILPEVIKPSTGSIVLESPEGEKYTFGEKVSFEGSSDKRNRVILHNVLVGIGFHWEHRENQRYRGNFEIMLDNRGLLTAINILPLEEYLFSVNSSEMKSDCPMELLKAQTVAARNTVLATRKKHHYADGFDVCADDHCQCYRGSSREKENSLEAVRLTAGEILLYKDIICDTRYSKICGGISEDFDSTWFSDPIPYMEATPDISSDRSREAGPLFPANSEEKARALIQSSTPFFCNVHQHEIPSTIQYAREYYRWQFIYEAGELGSLIEKKTGYEVGPVKELIPLERGRSGRIEWLKVKGSRKTVTIGKELQIRFALHEKCLYSSCFLIEKEERSNKQYFILKGAGWGHGVGMCQIGATVMAHQGYSHKDILSHYFPSTRLIELYEKFSKSAVQEYYHQQDRAGERCFEFFNCYEVHHCPVFQNKEGEKCWEFIENNNPTIFPPPIKEKLNCHECEFKKLHKEE